jgi:hypothetical protein
MDHSVPSSTAAFNKLPIEVSLLVIDAAVFFS